MIIDSSKHAQGQVVSFASVFRDVTQRSPQRALRDISKNGCEGDERTSWYCSYAGTTSLSWETLFIELNSGINSLLNAINIIILQSIYWQESVTHFSVATYSRKVLEQFLTTFWYLFDNFWRLLFLWPLSNCYNLPPVETIEFPTKVKGKFDILTSPPSIIPMFRLTDSNKIQQKSCPEDVKI